jgi:hypothetical protein
MTVSLSVSLSVSVFLSLSLSLSVSVSLCVCVCSLDVGMDKGDGYVALHLAVRARSAVLVQLLISAGADLNIQCVSTGADWCADAGLVLAGTCSC